MRTALLFSTVLALGLTAPAAIAIAQPVPAAPAAGTPPPAPDDHRAEMRARLMAADADHDGKWSKAEWLAAGRHERGFDFLDANKDGFVDKDELKAGMEKMRERRNNRG